MKQKIFNFEALTLLICLILFIGCGVLSGITIDKVNKIEQTVEKQKQNIISITNELNEEDVTKMQNRVNTPSSSEHTENSIDFEQFMQDYSTVNTNELLVIDESQLTEDMLLNRNGKLIISKCVGKVVSEDKDGCIINKAADKDYDYISYKCVEDCKIDDIIVTYLVYNPDNNYTDDIISRFDYIVSRNKTEN